MVNLIPRIHVLIIPNPYRIPVHNLLPFVDSYDVNFCVIPSIMSGSVPNRLIYGTLQKADTSIPSICPITIPVHLAHSGNWYFPIKKLRSGI